jgi:hypothetical protein
MARICSPTFRLQDLLPRSKRKSTKPGKENAGGKENAKEMVFTTETQRARNSEWKICRPAVPACFTDVAANSAFLREWINRFEPDLVLSGHLQSPPFYRGGVIAAQERRQFAEHRSGVEKT